jgi:hypothetical protein
MSFFFVLLALTITVLFRVAHSDTKSNSNVLKFLLLGDWGKGGSTGTYGSSIDDDEFQSTFALANTTTQASNGGGSSNKNGGGGSGQKTFYQVPIAKAMHRYASTKQSAVSPQKQVQ